MNRGALYESDDDEEEEDDDIGEDLEDLRRACIVPGSNSDDVIPKSGGGGEGEVPSDSENEEDDFEMLRSLKSQLATSTDPPPVGLPSLPSDSESDDDFELLRTLKSQLALSMDSRFPPMSLSDDDDEEDDSFETLRAIRRRFSAYANLDKDGAFMNDSLGKKKQGEQVVTLPDSEGTQAFGDSVDLRENTPLEQTRQSSSSFPEAAQAFVDAIRRNRAYQKFLRKKLTEIEAKIEQNEKHQKNVKIVVDFQASCKRMAKQALSQGKDPRLQLISTPKSGPRDSSEDNDKKISPLTFGPSENPCVESYRMALKTHPVSVHRRSWSAEENENLAKGLKQQVQETLLLEAIERSSDLEGCSDDIDTINESIKNLEITPEMIRQFLPKVNWDQLASMYFKDRSAAECEARWMSSEDPLINHGPWTAEEENNLRIIIQEKGFKDWLDIAVSLGTNRTPFQCLARYQRSLNADILRKEWTPEEDDQLRAAVELYGEKDWQTVANALEGRAGTQCSNRWKKTLHPTRTRVGKFSSEEEKRLRVAVTLFGAQNWHKIARFVPGRTSTQCREKWANCLDPNVNHGKWTEEEDTKLREAMKEHEIGNWSKIASHVPRRTDNQCRRRWMQLYPHQVPLLQEATRLRKEAIVGNFVDRESQRPALLECKFLALPEIPLEPEPENVPVKKKRKARTKKSDSGCESEASSAAKERRPKRRRKGLERCSGDVCRQEDETICENIENLDNGGEVRSLECCNENQDNVKEKKQRRRRKSVAETSNNSTVTTDCSHIEVGVKKLTPRRMKVSAVVPSENQDAQN
ncbi:Myb domain protein 4r1 [Hirschfeldia incana]|nr:Myb domain protein 4r1 [Hirschfeldia incana]